jgi:hypothetical protein
MNQQQRTQARLQQLAGEAAALYDRADAEGRGLTWAERQEAEKKMASFKSLRARVQAFEVAGRIGTPGDPSDAGRAFAESEGYKSIRRSGDAGAALDHRRDPGRIPAGQGDPAGGRRCAR